MNYNIEKTYPKELGKTQQCAQYVLYQYLNELPMTSIDKKHQGAYASQAGVSDFFGVSSGKAVYIEVKAENGKPSPPQISFIRGKKEAGAMAGFAMSIADCLEILNGGFGREFRGKWENENSGK